METITSEFKSIEKHPVIRTTLYDLIDAIGREVPAEEDNLVVATVMHLLQSGRVRFLGNPESYN
jgi:hypothetical protein